MRLLIRLVHDCVLASLVNYHFLNGDPSYAFLCEAFIFPLLSLNVLHEKHAHEEIHEEKAANQNKDHKEETHDHVVFLLWPLVNIIHSVNCLDHNIRPPLQTCNVKQRQHSLENIIEILLKAEPTPSIYVAFVFGVVCVYSNRAVEKLSRKNIDRKNRKH